jgi:ubiquinone/menaquinone biosynthesis C-methylase UbiE
MTKEGDMSDTIVAPRAGGSSQMQAELWGARPRDWADIQEPLFRPLYEAVLARPELAGARMSLDVGCGAGLAVQMFAEKVPGVAGLDACPALIEVARTRTPCADLRAGEMEALPYADESFDVVTGFNAFQYAASPVNALREARRVAKPGRAVVIATWGAPEACEAAGHLKALGALMPPPPPGAPGPFALSDEAKLRTLAHEAGLAPLAVADVAVPWTYASLDEALRGMLAAGPAQKAIRNSGLEKARAAVSEAIAPYRQASGGYRLRNQFRYLIATA